VKKVLHPYCCNGTDGYRTDKCRLKLCKFFSCPLNNDDIEREREFTFAKSMQIIKRTDKY